MSVVEQILVRFAQRVSDFHVLNLAAPPENIGRTARIQHATTSFLQLRQQVEERLAEANLSPYEQGRARAAAERLDDAFVNIIRANSLHARPTEAEIAFALALGLSAAVIGWAVVGATVLRALAGGGASSSSVNNTVIGYR